MSSLSRINSIPFLLVLVQYPAASVTTQLRYNATTEQYHRFDAALATISHPNSSYLTATLRMWLVLSVSSFACPTWWHGAHILILGRKIFTNHQIYINNYVIILSEETGEVFLVKN